MKKQILTIIATVSVMALISFTYQDDKKGLGKVKVLEGVEVYVLSEPLRAYTVVDELRMYTFANSPIYKVVETTAYAAKKEGKDFDALIINEGRMAMLIKWKD